MADYTKLTDYITTEYQDRIEFELNVEMKNYTSFRIGGPCDVAVFPLDSDAFCRIMEFICENRYKHIVIGNGSNVLFADSGYRGVVIFTSKMKSYRFEDDILVCDAGAQLTTVAVNAVKKGYDGFAFACGIPGTVGGAVYMNAGAYEGQVADVLLYSDYYDRKTGEIGRLVGEEHKLAYRHSAYMDCERIVLSAGFRLKKSENPEEQLRLMEDHVKARREKQPLEYPSAGSVFKRYPGYFTAALIDEAGLKGYTVGGAQVSEKHAGFIVNRGNATAADVLELIRIIKEKIFEMKGIHIECEVRYID